MHVDLQSTYLKKHVFLEHVAIDVANQDHAIVVWDDNRDRQRVYEGDLRDNYSLLKPYLLKFGGKSPLPELHHHEA